VRTPHNFSGGPGALPEVVIEQASEALRQAPGSELGLLGISHRSDWFREVVDEAERNTRRLLGLSEDYAVLFLQGGGSLQFSMVPMLLLRGSVSAADYVHSGYWSGKAIPEARMEGRVRLAWDGSRCGFSRLPSDDELELQPDAVYLHYVSNETVEGLQFQRVLGREQVLRVCDMSSDFMSRPVALERYAIVYAHAQKNLGPSGVTLVIVRKELLAREPAPIPSMLSYRHHLQHRSIFNTPPVFAIYVTLLVTRWLLEDIGGLARMDALNRQKAAALYRLIDDSEGFYRGRAELGSRSLMNVVFGLAAPELEQAFLAEALRAGLHGLPGHRSIGGIRASLYNAVSLESVHRLCEVMRDFRLRNRG